jgi:tripartite ATP-independent transporter DctM subunit
MTWIGLALLFLLLLTGIPVAFALGLSGVVGLYLVAGLDGLLGVLQSTPISAVASYELITIPMFLFMAQLVMVSGVGDDLFRAAAAWVGRFPGGLGVATALAGAGFGAICGTSTAAAATLSTTSLPAMIRHGYEPQLAAGVVAISGTLAMLIPPSVILIIYGLLADVNVGALLIGGVIPGLIVTIAIALTVVLLAVRHPERAPRGPRIPRGEKIALLRVVGPVIVLMMMVTGVIYTGVATPTEASAVGAAGACAIALWRRRLDRASLMRAAREAVHATCMIAAIVMCASIFGFYFTLTGLTQDVVTWVANLEVSRWVVMTLLLGLYIVLGCFLDQIAILVLTIPVVTPVVAALGFDPVWFGVMVVLTAEVGMITPPLGLNCFVVARAAGRPVGEVFAGVFPHFWAHLLVIGLLMAFPALITWLPSRMS